MTMLQHIARRMDARKPVRLEIVDEQKHQRLVVEELLETLKGELVEVVVYADHLHLGYGVVFQQFEHLLGIDETAQIEDKILHWYL